MTIQDRIKDYKDLIEANRKELQFRGFVSPDILRSETKMANHAIKDLEVIKDYFDIQWHGRK